MGYSGWMKWIVRETKGVWITVHIITLENMTAPLLRLLQLSVQVSLFHYLYVGILNKQAMDENFTHSCHKVVLNNKENYYCVCTPPNWVLFYPMFISHPKCMDLLFFLPCCCGGRKHENRLTEGQTDRQTDRQTDHETGWMWLFTMLYLCNLNQSLWMMPQTLYFADVVPPVFLHHFVCT